MTFIEDLVDHAAEIIVAMTGFGAMIGGFWLQGRSTRKQFDQQNTKIDRNAIIAADERDHIAGKIEDVRIATNGMKDELIKATAKSSRSEGRAEGVIEGRAAEKQDNADDAANL